MKRGPVGLMLAVGLVLALAGCGGGTTTGSPGPAATSPGGIAAPGSQPAQPTGASGPPTAVLHATVAITGGKQVAGSYDTSMPTGVITCADVAANGTGERLAGQQPSFNVPEPPSTGGNAGSVGGGHTFGTDASVSAGAGGSYPGPGTYSGSGVTATQILVDPPAGSEDTGIFAPTTGDLGTIIVNGNGSGSYQFSAWEDPGGVTISGEVTWTCADAGH
jgi:hypothetical protein